MFCAKKSFYFVLTVAFVLLSYDGVDCKKKSGGTSGRRGGSSKHTTPSSYTSSHHQQNHYQANAPPYPVSSNNNNPVGFENVHHRTQGGQYQANAPPYPASNSNPVGFENVHHRTQGGQYQANPPPYPAGNNNPIGFENVHQRVGSNQPNVPSQPGFGYPSNTNYHPSNNYHPQGAGAGGGYYNQPGVNQGQYYNRGLAQPNSYYTPVQAVPGGVQPQIYQPSYTHQQPSSSSGIGAASVLGFAGSFAGGYLIGKLTSGGGHDSDDRPYTVHHYHHNRDDVPQKLFVSDGNLATCSQNQTEGLCVPNTFPICLANGTIMCVTHMPFTTPCNGGNMSCVVTVLPCPKNDTTCNSTENVPTTAIYIPCISNVTVARGNNVDAAVVDPGSQKTQLCVTAIAEPKTTLTRVGSLTMLVANMLAMPFADANDLNSTSNTQNQTTSVWLNQPPQQANISTTPDNSSAPPVTTTPVPASVLLNDTSTTNLPPTHHPDYNINSTETSRWI